MRCNATAGVLLAKRAQNISETGKISVNIPDLRSVFGVCSSGGQSGRKKIDLGAHLKTGLEASSGRENIGRPNSFGDVKIKHVFIGRG